MSDQVSHICQDCLQIIGDWVVALTDDGVLNGIDTQNGDLAWSVRLNETPRQLMNLNGKAGVLDKEEDDVGLSRCDRNQDADRHHHGGEGQYNSGSVSFNHHFPLPNYARTAIKTRCLLKLFKPLLQKLIGEVTKGPRKIPKGTLLEYHISLFFAR